MASGDDELRSVRIELEDDAALIPDAPLSTGDGTDAGPKEPSGGPPAWAIVLAILIVGLVGFGLLSLRPEGDAAADGSERQAPTTETENADGEDDEVTENDPDAADPNAARSDDEETAVDPTNGVEGDEVSVVPTPLITDGSIAEIIAADIGFVALSQRGGARPTILRSVDGEDWFDVETTATINGVANDERFNWFNLTNFGDLLAVTVTTDDQGFLPTTEVFVSDTGADWVQLELPEVTNGESALFFPVNFSDDNIFGVRFETGGVFEDFLTQTTTVEIPENGVCDISPTSFSDAEPQGFGITDCTGELAFVLTADQVVPTLPVEEVLSCLQFLPGLASRSFDLVRLDFDSGQRVSVGQITPFLLPVPVSNGGIAGVDAGRAGPNPEGPCDGLIDSVDQIDPAIFIAGRTAPEPERFPFPGEIPPADIAAEIGDFSGLGIVGEVNVGDAASLVIQFDDALWALNLETDEWSDPLTSETTPFPDGFGRQVNLSESGLRAYVIVDSLFITFDFVAGSDGALEVIETIQPISLLDGPGQNVNFAQFLYANDEVVFIGDGFGSWSIETPPLPNE